MGNEQCKIRQDVRKLFNDRGNHHHSISARISADQQKDHLESEGDANESIIELWVIHGRWALPADKAAQEIQRQRDQDAPDSGPREDDLGKSHNSTPCSAFNTR